MDVSKLADMGPAVLLTSSRSVDDIQKALEQVLEFTPGFTHYTIIHGGTGSVRLFLQAPFEGAVELPPSGSTAYAVAEELVAFAEAGARYSDCPVAGRVKGWNIRAITIGQKKAAIAEAVWV